MEENNISNMLSDHLNIFNEFNWKAKNCEINGINSISNDSFFIHTESSSINEISICLKLKIFDSNNKLFS